MRAVADLGIPALLLFGLPHTKDWLGSEAWAVDGIVQQVFDQLNAQGGIGGRKLDLVVVARGVAGHRQRVVCQR